MSDISTWSTTADNNNSPSPNGFPEGMAPSGLNNAAREVMAAVKTWHERLNVAGASALVDLTPVNGERYYLQYFSTDGDYSGEYRGVTGAASSTYQTDNSMIFVPSGGDGSTAFVKQTPPGEYHIHAGCSVANIERICALMNSDQYDSHVLRFLPGDYTIDSTVDLDVPESTTIFAHGARFDCTANGIAFDVNPDATAAIPVTTTADIYTKRRVKWHGGHFSNSNATKTASAAMQAYFMRDFEFLPEYVTAFGFGIKFGAKDTYRIGGYYYDCDISIYSPAAGVLHTSSLTGNDTIRAEIGGHISCAGNTNAIAILNRAIDIKISSSINGATTGPQVRLVDGHIAGRSYKFNGLHSEQGAAGIPCVQFEATNGTGFLNVDFDGATEFSSGTVGWYGVKLAKCWFVKFGSVLFVDGSGGSTETGIYVDDDSRNISINTDSCQFTTWSAGRQIVLETSTNRQYVTLTPSVAILDTPILLTNYNNDTFSTVTATIDMSTEFSGFGDYLLPPLGYSIIITAKDSGSAAAASDAVCRVRLKKDATVSDNSAVSVFLGGLPNNFRVMSSGVVSADANGDIYADIGASGAGTLTAWASVTAVHQ